jgi:hypothetical protein
LNSTILQESNRYRKNNHYEMNSTIAFFQSLRAKEISLLKWINETNGYMETKLKALNTYRHKDTHMRSDRKKKKRTHTNM